MPTTTVARSHAAPLAPAPIGPNDFGGSPFEASATSIDAADEAAASVAAIAAPHATRPPKMSFDIDSAKPSARMRAFCSGSTLSPLIAPIVIVWPIHAPNSASANGIAAHAKTTPAGKRFPRTTNAPKSAIRIGATRSERRMRYIGHPPFRNSIHAPVGPWPMTLKKRSDSAIARNPARPMMIVSGTRRARGSGRPPATAPPSRYMPWFAIARPRYQGPLGDAFRTPTLTSLT